MTERRYSQRSVNQVRMGHFCIDRSEGFLISNIILGSFVLASTR